MSDLFYRPAGATPQVPGRYCHLAGIPEVQDLQVGMDFRRPEFRREVFLRFYEFHLQYRAHPGCVYFVMPYLYTAFKWDREAAAVVCLHQRQHAESSNVMDYLQTLSGLREPENRRPREVVQSGVQAASL